MADCTLVFEVSKAYLLAQPQLFVRAWGIASTNASNARLVRSDDPTLPETLLLDFCVDPGPLQVLTEVEAVLPLESIDGYREIIVRGKINSVMIHVQ